MKVTRQCLLYISKNRTSRAYSVGPKKVNMKTSWVVTPLVLAIVARLLLQSDKVIPRNTLPGHLLGHKIYVQKELITPQVGSDLVKLVDSIGLKKGYPTNTADVKFYHTEHEHIGEARDAKTTPDGRVICDNPFLIPSMDRKQCILAGRMDIGRHLILTGGARGLREKYEKIVSCRFVFQMKFSIA